MPEPRRLLLTPEAVSDIDRLDFFLRPVSLIAADRLQDAFSSAFHKLVDFPFSGRVWASSPHGRDIRELFLPFGRRGYVLRYEVTSTQIIVARIHHGLEDREPH